VGCSVGPDAEFEAEQAYLDGAYAELARMRAKAAALVGESEDPDLEAALARRVTLLTDTGRPLCFGRIDAALGERWYIGRRHVEDDAGDPVVVEWRAPIAVPFYRASLADPLGLERRRQFVVDGQHLLSMADDRFGPDAASDTDPRVRGRDALLAELERARAGEMLDIAATIQAEQDVVIRAPLEGVRVVQGGPGTGKTAIGLHRAAFLLYNHVELARSGVLVIGPNRVFLRYIALVLPSLGEEAVVQTTLTDLVSDVRVRAQDEPAIARLKGDRRMAAVLARALADRRQPIDADVQLRYGLVRLSIPAADANAEVARLASRSGPYTAGRTALRERLLRLAWQSYERTVGIMNTTDSTAVAKALRSEPAFAAALDRLWPSISAPALVRELLASPSRLARAAHGLLDETEQRLLIRTATARSGEVPWTDADAALVDEAHQLLAGRIRNYGHVVVDEAQDLSPMQLRMLARRAPNGSLTVLGDLAQGTGVWAHDTWEEIVEHLPTPRGWDFSELTLGYRAPGQVLELASRLLPFAAPLITPTESIRPGRTSPAIIRVPDDELAARAAFEAGQLAAIHGSVGVIGPASRLPALAAGLAAAGLDYAEASRHGLSHRVSLLAGPQAKGLEFDAVVLVEPADVVSEAVQGLRLLYVCLTRPTQHLSIVHAAPLPDPLVGEPALA
jgi:DNA helicase IV